MADDGARSKLPVLRQLATPNLSDALDRLGIPAAMVGIRILDFGMERMAGLARTVLQGPLRTDADPDRIHVRHIELADEAVGPDEVIVIGVLGEVAASSWGHLLSLRSRARGAAGTVTDGTVRDPKEIVELGYPVFSNGAVFTGGSKFRLQTLVVDDPIVCGGVTVRPGDFVVGDDSGVVVIPPDRVDEAIGIATEIARAEEETARRILRGGTLKSPA